MVTASGTSKASTSPDSVALRSASIRLKPMPWSRAAWPAWTHTPNCCLSSAPCPLSTREIVRSDHSLHPVGRPPAQQPLLPLAHSPRLGAFTVFSFPYPFTHSSASSQPGPGGLTAPVSQSWFFPGRVTFRAGHPSPRAPHSTPIPHPPLKFDEIEPLC